MPLRTKPRTFQIQNPGAGNQWSFTPSTTDRVVMMAVTATFTSDAVVASRMPGISYQDQSGLTYWSGGCGQAQPASRSGIYSWAPIADSNITTAVTAGQSVPLSLPNIWLDANDEIVSVCPLMDPGDTWTNIVIRYYTGERWLELQRELAVAQYLES